MRVTRALVRTLRPGSRRWLSTSPSSSAALPIVALDDPTGASIPQLAAAFAEFGCCYVTGHRVTRLLEQRTMASARALCALPEEVKTAIPVVHNGRGFTRGYIGMGTESGSADRIEVKEAFSYGYEWPAGTRSFANGLQGHNVWPLVATARDHNAGRAASSWSDVTDRAALNEFFVAMAATAREISRQLSETLYGDPAVLDGHCRHGDTISIMRLFHYFPYGHYDGPPDDTRERIGSSPHTDWGFLTLILQDDIGGLQVRHRGAWLDVPPVPDSLVVNAGDYLSLVTRGRCVSPVHRVVATDRERLSMVFFYYPDFDAVIPPVRERAVARIGGNHEGDDAFNNLLDGTVRQVDGCFGEYIMDKWAGVQRG